MDDAQLAAVEGGYGFDLCFDCTHVSEINQSNWATNYFNGVIVSIAGDDSDVEVDQEIEQSNRADVDQRVQLRARWQGGCTPPQCSRRYPLRGYRVVW